MSIKPHRLTPSILDLGDLMLTKNVRSPRPRPAPSSSSASGPSDPLSAAETSRKAARVFPDKKAYRFELYAHIQKHAQMGLLFQHANLSTAMWDQLRRAVADIPIPPGAEEAIRLPEVFVQGKGKRKVPAPQPVNNSEAIWPKGGANVQFLRTNVFRAMSNRMVYRNKATAKRSIEPWMSKTTALISAPIVSPKYIDQILRVCQRVLRQNRKDDKVPKEKQPRFDLVVARVERKVVGLEEIERIRKLPELDTLRAQTIGLLQGAGQQVVGLLSQAAGGSLVRTLQGLEKDLKAKEGGGDASPSGETPA